MTEKNNTYSYSFNVCGLAVINVNDIICRNENMNMNIIFRTACLPEGKIYVHTGFKFKTFTKVFMSFSMLSRRGKSEKADETR